MLNPIICPQCFQPNEPVRAGCWKCLAPLSRVADLNDFLRFFQLKPQWTKDEARLAFHRLARIYHPDHNPMKREADAYFKFVNEGYEMLSRMQPTEQPAEAPPKQQAAPPPPIEEEPISDELKEKLEKLINSKYQKPIDEKKSTFQKLNSWLHKVAKK